MVVGKGEGDKPTRKGMSIEEMALQVIALCSGVNEGSDTLPWPLATCSPGIMRVGKLPLPLLTVAPGEQALHLAWAAQ